MIIYPKLVAAGWDAASPRERAELIGSEFTFTTNALSKMDWDDLPEMVREYVIPRW